MNIYADTVRHVSTLMFISFFFSKGELYAGLSAQKSCRKRFCRPLTKPLIQGTVMPKERGSWRIRTAVNGFADR